MQFTDDSEDKLKGFLKTTPIKTWIGIDQERTNQSSFNIHAIPTTVIVGADGRLVATTTETVTAQVLRDVIDGKTVKLAPAETREVNLEWDRDEIEWKDGVSPISEVIIKRMSTATAALRLRPEGNYLTADGVALDSLVQVAYQTDHFHLNWRLPASASDSFYRVAARVPKGREQQLLPLLQNALIATFGFKVHWEQEEKDVYVLRIPANSKPTLTASTSDEKPFLQASKGQASAKRQPLAKLVTSLTNELRFLVVDESGLLGDYDWEYPYQMGQPNVTIQAVKDRLGLELIKARRKIKTLVVEPAETIGPR